MTRDQKDRRYFLQRAAEELNMVGKSKDQSTAAIHRRLAKLYLDRAEALGDDDRK